MVPYLPSKDTLKLIGALAIGAGVLFSYQTVISWKEGYDKSQQQTRTAEATTGIIEDGDVSGTARNEADQSGATNRQNFDDAVEEDARNEPETASRDAGVVPASRLRAFEQRRLERERIACDRLRRSGLECPARSGTEDSSER